RPPRRRVMIAGAVAVWAAAFALGAGARSPLSAAAQSAAPAPSTVAPRQTLTTYCVTCHNTRTQAGGLTLDTVDVDNPSAHADALEKVVRKLRTGMMPPAGAPRPDPAVRQA